MICSSMKRALRIVVPLYEDRKFTENYNFRNVRESGFGSQSNLHLIRLSEKRGPSLSVAVRLFTGAGGPGCGGAGYKERCPGQYGAVRRGLEGAC